MEDTWSQYWQSFLDQKKLHEIVNQMNEFDRLEGNAPQTESICHDIFNEQLSVNERFEDIRQDLIKVFEKLPGVHLHTSRVKICDSLLQKVIMKRHEQLADKKAPYSQICGTNYKDIVTDLIGIRLIISYRGDWQELHNAIVSEFPYVQQEKYKKSHFISHEEGTQFLAEIPKVYYAYGDSLSIYEGNIVQFELRENGYRSVHYVLGYKGIYVELQVRTIYDEAWSDCDHRYVYKHDDNISYAGLKQLSRVLCAYTNASNDLGEQMRLIFNGDSVLDQGQGYIVSDKVYQSIEEIYQKYNEAQNKFLEFKNMLSIKEGEENVE